jgi:hypothetical protein
MPCARACVRRIESRGPPVRGVPRPMLPRDCEICPCQGFYSLHAPPRYAFECGRFRQRARREAQKTAARLWARCRRVGGEDYRHGAKHSGIHTFIGSPGRKPQAYTQTTIPWKSRRSSSTDRLTHAQTGACRSSLRGHAPRPQRMHTRSVYPSATTVPCGDVDLWMYVSRL